MREFDCALQGSAPLKISPDFEMGLPGLSSTSGLERVCFLDMEKLHKRTHPTAWQDWKHDHWLAHAAFGLCLVALVAWLVILYRGYAVDF
jgi:hypothetical protein